MILCCNRQLGSLSMRLNLLFTGVSLAAVACAGIASAQSSTEIYIYDALGRLVKVETIGGQNHGETRDLAYDPAGNRTTYASTCTSTSCVPTPSPTPTPTPPPPSSAPSITISNASGVEGSVLTFVVTLSASHGSNISVGYATAPGTARADDFLAQSGVLTFAAGQISRTIAVQTVQDSFEEPDETFSVNLSNPTGGASLANTQAVGTIQNDDNWEPLCPPGQHPWLCFF